MNDKPLPNGWRATDLSPHKVDEHLSYVAQVAKELALIPRVKKEKPTHWNGKPIDSLTSEEREAFYFSQQPKSTQDALLLHKTRRPEQDTEWLLRPMPECVANPEAKTLDELTAKRNIDPEDALREKSLKTGRNSMAQSTKGSVEGERRDRGIQAFTYSKPANLSDSEVWRIKKLNEIDAVVAGEPPKPVAPPAPAPWWKIWDTRPMSKEEFDAYFGRNRKWWEFWK